MSTAPSISILDDPLREPSPAEFVMRRAPLVQAGVSGAGTATKIKSSSDWQIGLWQLWPREEVWPAKLDIYESAAYLRVSPDTIRRAVTVARDGKAQLAHQRVGAIYRIRKVDLDSFGAVRGRADRV